jgi:hypothetical protein
MDNLKKLFSETPILTLGNGIKLDEVKGGADASRRMTLAMADRLNHVNSFEY